MQWSLEDIYKNQVRGKIPPRKHLNVVEEQQGELYKQLAGGPRKGQLIPRPEKEKGLKQHEVTDTKK